MTVLFDSLEEAEDLIVTCNKCDKPRIFNVVGLLAEQADMYTLERCDKKDCECHCQCGLPSIQVDFEHRDVVGAISWYG